MNQTIARTGPAAVLAAGVAVLIWGGTPIATRIAVDTIDPAMVGMLRTLLAALLAPLLLLALRLPVPAGDRTRPLLAFSGLCAFALFPVLFSGIARIGTLQFLQPVASLILAVLILGEAMSLPLAACAAVVLAGTILAHRG